jgi:hypothetical protein
MIGTAQTYAPRTARVHSAYTKRTRVVRALTAQPSQHAGELPPLRFAFSLGTPPSKRQMVGSPGRGGRKQQGWLGSERVKVIRSKGSVQTEVGPKNFGGREEEEEEGERRTRTRVRARGRA